MRYRVEVRETAVYQFWVEASTRKAAQREADEQARDGDFPLEDCTVEEREVISVRADEAS